MRRFRAHAHYLNDVPVAFYETLNDHPLGGQDSFAMMGLDSQVSKFDPRSYSAYRARGGAVGVPTTHIDDALGFGWRDVLKSVKCYLERRFEVLKDQEQASAHVDVDLHQEKGFPAPKPQASSTKPKAHTRS